MKKTTGRPTARVLAFLRGATRREARLLGPTSAKRGQRSQPVKPRGGIGDQGQNAEPRADGHILALCTIFNQSRHAGPRSYFDRQQARLWTRGGRRRITHGGLLERLERCQGW